MANESLFSTTYEGARQGLGTIGEVILGIAGLYAKQKQREREMQMEFQQKKILTQIEAPSEKALREAEIKKIEAQTQKELEVTRGLKEGVQYKYWNTITNTESNKADPDAVLIRQIPTESGLKIEEVDLEKKEHNLGLSNNLLNKRKQLLSEPFGFFTNRDEINQIDQDLISLKERIQRKTKYKEGQRAKNPKTGEVKEFRGGKWVTIK